MQIYGEGGLLLGRALHYNSTLCELDMRLNRLGDMGGRVLLDGLVQNTTLTSINLSRLACFHTMGVTHTCGCVRVCA